MSKLEILRFYFCLDIKVILVKCVTKMNFMIFPA